MNEPRHSCLTADHDSETLSHALKALDEIAPGAPLVAFGQTPFWDEPLKCLIAERTSRRFIVGIHDLDYFSRIRTPLPGPRWQVVGRNEGALRDIWIAAGELSAIFGAEVWPTRARLMEAGINLDRVVSGRTAAAQLERATSSWGWRGIVENSMHPAVIRDVPAREILPGLRQLIHWGAAKTERLMGSPQRRASVREFGRALPVDMERFAVEQPQANLADLYHAMMRLMYERLLGRVPENVEFVATSALLRFNRSTASLPRFRFVEHFLDPRTAEAARAAYGAAVKDTAMTQLGEEADGLLPFELYLPGRGRGELRLQSDRLIVATQPPLEVPLQTPITSIEQLADVVETAVGTDASLLGKALSLPAMINGEFVMMLTETGSSYMPRTQEMLAAMKAAGLGAKANPLLRLRVRPFDALAAIEANLRLPEHLVQAFGRSEVTAAEFARGWRSAVRSQERLLQRLRRGGSPCDLVEMLGHEEHEQWFRRLDQCQRAQQVLLEVQKEADVLRHEALDVRAREDESVAEIKALEAERGAFNREQLRPLKRQLAEVEASQAQEEVARLRTKHDAADKHGQALLAALATKQEELKRCRSRRVEIATRLRALEHAGRAAHARRVLATMERMALRVRLRLARNAILTVDGLPHADARPSAWWFPAIDESGAWFERVRRTARARLEPLDRCTCQETK